MMNWIIKPFSELTIDELYALIHLRSVIFVVEQERPCLEPDNKDQRALHVLGYEGYTLVAYCRLFAAGNYLNEASIGRVVVASQFRRLGYGHHLMDEAIELMESRFGSSVIMISAQLYLKAFYESHGFIKVSDEYLEDGIPHIRMRRENL